MHTLKKKYYHRRADVHLLSYPKCGRTWLRFMLSTLLHEHFDMPVVNLHQIHKLGSRRRGIPCVYLTHDWRGPSGSVESMSLETSKRRFAGRKVLWLIRDPRDVVVSNFFQKKYREKTFGGEIGEFVRDPVRGIQGIVDYYSLWARQRAITSEFAVVRYEDMRADVVGELSRVLAYCGLVGVSEDHIAEVAERFTFDRMQRMERAGAFSGKSTTPGELGNPESYKTRSGKVGGYKDHLCNGDRDYVEQTIQVRLDPWFAEYRAGRAGA